MNALVGALIGRIRPAPATILICGFLVQMAVTIPGRCLGDDPAKSVDPANKAAAALYERIRAETLPNGLRVYLKPIPGAQVVTTMVAYKVGSADEDLDHTGLSHYLEHLMFKGTDKVMPGDIDRRTQRSGGTNNAYTSEDSTVYHFDLPAENWEWVLELEADRMRNLRIDEKHEFEQEKGAVIAELNRNEDSPWDLELKAVLPLLFAKGPYGHPVIGETDHVKGSTAEVIKSHYDRWYHPNNASLIIVGGFDSDRTITKIKETFGRIPEGKLPERKSFEPVSRKAPERKEIESKFETARLVMGFNTVRIGERDFYPLEVIQDILTNGKTSRLYKRLVEDEALAISVDSTNFAGRYPGWFGIQVEVVKGKDRAKVESIVLEEIKKLHDTLASATELKRVQRAIVAGAVFGRESAHGLADSIARGVTTNDLDFLKEYLPRIQAVTVLDVQEAARKYFNLEQRVAIWSVPGEHGTAPAEKPEKQPRRSRLQQPQAGGGNFTLKNTQRVELPNGLTLLLFENRRLPIVVAEASVKWVSHLEPEEKAGVAALMGNLLDEGSSRHTGTQIAEMIEDVGGSLSFSASGGTLKVLAPDRGLGLGLLFECLMQANFPQDAFNRKKTQILSTIADAERQPEKKASLAYKALAYGKHPYGRPSLGFAKTVESLKPADCQTFYQQSFVPNHTVVALVGDFDSKQVVDEVTKLTAEWKKGIVARPELPAVEKPKEFQEQIISMPSAAQLHLYMGHAGIRRADPDYYKLLVMDHVLGTGSGFTDRLSARLRDREGLGYTVSASISDGAGEEPSLFTCYIGTEAENLERVKKTFIEEIEKLRTDKPTAEEVDDAKKYLLGSLAFQFTTNDRIAGRLLSIERYNLGFEFLEDYRKAVSAVTPDEVQAVAQKHLDTKHMVLVAVGAVDASGKPLVKLPAPKKSE